MLSFGSHKLLLCRLKLPQQSTLLTRHAISNHTEEVWEVRFQQPLPFADLLPGNSIHTASPTCHYRTQRWVAPQRPTRCKPHNLELTEAKWGDSEESATVSDPILMFEGSLRILGTKEIQHPILSLKDTKPNFFGRGHELLQRGGESVEPKSSVPSSCVCLCIYVCVCLGKCFSHVVSYLFLT